MNSEPLDITGEALKFYRTHLENWLKLKLATDAERELARTKIALIDRELVAS